MKRHASQASSNDANVPKLAPPIATNNELNAIITQYQNAEFLAVDTEFLRESTYYPQLCLIQISDQIIKIFQPNGKPDHFVTGTSQGTVFVR